MTGIMKRGVSQTVMDFSCRGVLRWFVIAVGIVVMFTRGGAVNWFGICSQKRQHMVVNINQEQVNIAADLKDLGVNLGIQSWLLYDFKSLGTMLHLIVGSLLEATLGYLLVLWLALTERLRAGFRVGLQLWSTQGLEEGNNWAVHDQSRHLLNCSTARFWMEWNIRTTWKQALIRLWPWYLCLFLFISGNSLLVQAAAGPASTKFGFPVFPSPEEHSIMTFGDVQHNANNLSFTMNTNAIKTGAPKLLFTDRVRMKNWDASAVASFSTSFTFSITQQEKNTNRCGWEQWASGLCFILISENVSSLLVGRTFAERRSRTPHVADHGNHFLSVEFDTYNSYINEDPSDNHIGVDINSPKSVYTYNLCGGETTQCSFPWTGRVYTSWIEYNGSTQSLEVWFANGSMADGVRKPEGSGLIKASKLDLMEAFDEYMYVGFAANMGPHGDTQEILSWNFESSLKEEEPLPISTRRHSLSITLVSGITFASSVIALLLIGICLLQGCWGRHPVPKRFEPEINCLLGTRRFTFKELRKATKNFNESALLGKGGFGAVYKGTLAPSGMAVAVKRLTHTCENGEREFLAEVSTISQIRHRNLVELQGWCYEDGHFLLVFHYMSNGSLDEWLFPSCRRCPHVDRKDKKFEVLPWELRFSILAGVAAALEYLHEDCVKCVLHRDIKSSNVMLDADFNPHLGDFGLARLIDHEKLEKTTMMAGTLGYMAPEIPFTGKATKESDIYSYGILMLEVLCGRRPINLSVEDPDEDFLLLQSVRRAHEAGNILSAVDPRLLNLHFDHDLKVPNCSIAASDHIAIFMNSTHESEEVNKMYPSKFSAVKSGATFTQCGEETRIMHLLRLGLHCCLADPESRPPMRVVKQVIMQLQASSMEDIMTPLNPMPPLPPILPVYDRSSLQVPATTYSSKVPQEMEASFMSRSSDNSSIRRRFQSS